jgi:hypothetical protein
MNNDREASTPLPLDDVEKYIIAAEQKTSIISSLIRDTAIIKSMEDWPDSEMLPLCEFFCGCVSLSRILRNALGIDSSADVSSTIAELKKTQATLMLTNKEAVIAATFVATSALLEAELKVKYGITISVN